MVILKKKFTWACPPGYTTSFEAKIVCKLEQALYGLKQSPGHGLADLVRL